MESEIEKRRKIDRILSPPIVEANKLAGQLKERSNALKAKIAETEALLAKRRAALAQAAKERKAIKLRLRRT